MNTARGNQRPHATTGSTSRVSRSWARSNVDTERRTHTAPWIDGRDYSYETHTRARVVRGLAFDGAELHTLAHFADEDPAVVTLALAGLHEQDPLADHSALTAEGARCRLHELLRYLIRQ